MRRAFSLHATFRTLVMTSAGCCPAHVAVVGLVTVVFHLECWQVTGGGGGYYLPVLAVRICPEDALAKGLVCAPSITLATTCAVGLDARQSTGAITGAWGLTRGCCGGCGGGYTSRAIRTAVSAMLVAGATLIVR